MNSNVTPQRPSTHKSPWLPAIRSLAGLVLASVVIAAVPGAGQGEAAHDHAAHDQAFAGMPAPEAFAMPTLTPGVAAADSTASTLGTPTVRLRAGIYTLSLLGGRGEVLGTRKISLAVARVWGTKADEATYGKSRYLELTSGPHAGWFIPAGSTAPRGLVEHQPALTVELAAGTVVGKRFFGPATLRLPVTLAKPTTYSAAAQAKFGTATHYRLADGPLAGRWVPAGKVTVASSGSATTPTATPQPTTAPEIAPRATWKTIVLLYRETDVTFRRANGQDYRLTARMNNTMYNLVRDTLGRYQASVKSWSGGVAQLDMEIVDMPHPLTKLDVLGSGYWVGPDAVRSDMNTYAPKGSYDSIVVVYEPRDSAGVSIPIGGWGLTIPDGSWSNGAGFSSVITPAELWWWTGSTAPEEVFIHEWMHQVIFFHERHGRANVDLHAGAQYGYSNADGTWKRWMSDLMQNKVKDGSKLLGISADAWAAGKPSAP